jgi:hypothetical protein
VCVVYVCMYACMYVCVDNCLHDLNTDHDVRNEKSVVGPDIVCLCV